MEQSGTEKRECEHHSPETRAAVMAALLEGQGVNRVADIYNLPKATVSRWKSKIETEGISIDQIKQEKIVALIEGHLSSSLISAANIARLTENKQWLFEQSAEKLAVLYGVISDKAFRILEAIENAHKSNES